MLKFPKFEQFLKHHQFFEKILHSTQLFGMCKVQLFAWFNIFCLK